MKKMPPSRPSLLVPSKGAQQIETLSALLPDYRLLKGTTRDIKQADAVLAWGRKPSALHAQRIALKAGLPLITVEDGFLRSVGLGPDVPPLSLIVDDMGVYFDTTTPSRLEVLIPRPLERTEQTRIQTLLASWRTERVSKYNHTRSAFPTLQQPCVLVADQTRGDASLQGANEAHFRSMLQAALDEYPNSTVIVKIHPDVLAGRKQGHFDIGALHSHPRVQVMSKDIHPADLLPQVQAVYVMTSQLGFDALLWGVPVRTFGMPFYAGWGLTQDELPPPTRRQRISLEQLSHATLIDYSRYVDPESGEPCSVERVMAWLGLQRRMRSRLPEELQMVGFSRWKRPLVLDFFSGSKPRFVEQLSELNETGQIVSWGCKYDQALEEQASGRSVIRVEDGFLRSVGLGAGKNRPLSWVIDDLGIYYDATRPSRLERILQDTTFGPDLLQRAATLRESICSSGVTKYNLPGTAWQRPAGKERVILVPGQVESDASIRFGAHRIYRNLDLLRAVRERHPDAWLLYKPHPEVLMGTREQGNKEALAGSYCNQVVENAPFQALLEEVDEVHALTSQSGFEALLRGVPVTTYGQPFYAGWGLTCDEGIQPSVQARRTRRLSLDELVAGVLICYPTYVSKVTHRFSTAERILLELLSWHELPGKEGKSLKWLEVIRQLLQNLLPKKSQQKD